jgi:hypothetical protein
MDGRDGSEAGAEADGSGTTDATDATDATDGGEVTDATDAADAGDVTVATANGVTARYSVADGERRLAFERDGRTAVVAQNLDGYAMLKVRPSPDGDELERYYGFDMALDHAAELLGVAPAALPVPEPARDMGM